MKEIRLQALALARKIKNNERIGMMSYCSPPLRSPPSSNFTPLIRRDFSSM